MKKLVFHLLILLVPISFVYNAEAFLGAENKTDDINSDGRVDILDVLEWERGRLADDTLSLLPENRPELPTSTDAIALGSHPSSRGYQNVPTLLVKSEDGAGFGALQGVTNIAPLVNPKIQIKFLIRILDWVSKNRIASSEAFQRSIDQERQRLNEYATALSDAQSIPLFVINESRAFVQRVVYDGLSERMFPEFFPESVDAVFNNIEEVVSWNRVSFVSESDLQKAMQALGGESVRGRVVVERNRLFKAAYNPNDTYFNPALRDFITTLRDAWAWDNARFPGAWDQTRGSNNVITAILDSGFDANHPDLGGRMWRNAGDLRNGIDDDLNGFVDDYQGWDFVGGGGWHTTGPWEDYNGHGTIMAGIIGADSDNGMGIAGGSFLGRFMNLVVLNEGGYGQSATIDAGFSYAIAMGADIINLSFSGSVWSPSLENLTQLAESLDIAVVAAAGNAFGEEARFYSPVNIKEAVSVGSSTPSMAVSSFSNIGFGVDFYAPGGGSPISPYSFVMTTLPEYTIPVPMSQTLYSPPSWYYILQLPDPYYWRVAGTSISAAFASSAVNLIKALRPTLTGAQIRQALRVAALQRGGGTGIVDANGYGDLDVNAALLLDPMLEVKITSPGYFSPKFQSDVPIEGVVRNPGGISIYQVELSYRAVGDTTSTPIASLGVSSSVQYNWDIQSLPDGEYYLELRARTSPLSPWSIDTMLIRKRPLWYEDESDPSLPLVASYSVEGVDVDNDGDKDLAVANIGNAYAGLTPMPNNLFINNGSSGFVDESFRFRNQNPEYTLKLIPADLNGDSFVDFIEIAIVISSRDDIFIWINEGSSNPGYFNRSALLPGPTFTLGGAVGDVDRDGDLDIFLATFWGGQNRLLINNGSAVFSDQSNRLPQESTYHAGSAFADFDRDGDLDIITGSWVQPGATTFSTQLYMNNGAGVFTNRTSTWLSQNISTWYDIEATDLDNDGDVDVILNNSFYLLNNGGSFRSISLNSTHQFSDGLLINYETGDVDRDGRVDLMMLDGIHSVMLRNSGIDPVTNSILWENKTLDWLPTYRNVEIGVNDSDLVDWDNDGDLDMFLGANGRFFTEILRLYSLSRALVGDVDGDGEVTILDALIIARYSAGFGGWTAAQVAVGDVDGNPGITVADALVLARIAAHLASSGVATTQGESCSYCLGNPAF